ncbi:MAG: hypothetical protein WCP46_06725 [Alphaproteobacteria bacterium]
MFEYLDLIIGKIIIVETGCVRNPDPWAMTGEGHSTLLFDQYVKKRNDGSMVFTVDINPESVAVCRTLVSNNVTIYEGDSVSYLNNLSQKLLSEGHFINLLYLDSYDVDFNYWYPSAAHHLKELLSARRAINSNTLVVVDDSPMNANLVLDNEGTYHLDKFYKPIVGGKGRLVAEYADQVGAKTLFSHYQHGWNGF